MASTLKHLRSSTADKRPTASGLVDGQLAINTASGTPALFFKDSNGGVVKVGPAHVGSAAPNAVPAGSAGNSLGELWVDNSLTTPGLNYYTGSAFVNLTPSGTTAAVGLVELATSAETQTGTDGVRAVTPSGLQSKVSDSTSTTSSTTIASSTAVKSAYDLANAALPKAGGTVTGELLIGTTGSLVFEGSSDDSFETTIAVTNPTADHTITFPNVTGAVVTTGDSGTVTSTMIANDTIVNADINSAAAIVDTKLATISTADKVSVSALNIDGATDIGGALENGDLFIVDDGAGGTNRKAPAFRMAQLTYSGVTGDITIASGGTSAIGAGVIVNADVNASAAIAGTKISPDFGSQNVVTTGTSSAAALIPTGSSVPTNGVYLPSSNNVAISTNGSGRLFIDSSGNVGINVANPATRLDVNGNTRISGGGIRALGYYSDSTSAYNVTLGTTGNVGYLQAVNVGNLSQLSIDGSPIVFRFGSYSEAMRLDSSGRLGIGTASPAFKLHVAGGGNNGAIRAEDTSASAILYVNPAFATGVPALHTGSAHPLAFAINTTEVARFDTSGRLGLGTSSPEQKFEIAQSGMFSRSLVFETSASNNCFITAKATGASTSLNTVLNLRADGTTVNGTIIFSRGLNRTYTESMRIDDSGRLGIATASPATTLDVNGDVTITDKIIHGGDTNTAIRFPAADTVSVETAGSERARIDSSGRLLVGTSSARSNFQNGAVTCRAQIEGTDYQNTGLAIISNDSSQVQRPILYLYRSNGSSVGSNTLVASGDICGQVIFGGNDGTEFVNAAVIAAEIDGTPGANDMPGRLVFSTTADGASSPTERMRITSGGKLTVPGVYDGTTTGGSAVYVESDGDLLRFTSSRKYKTDIETLEDERADAILDCRPVWYRSLCENDIKTVGSDRSDWGWYGLIAEEVAEIDPRLVNWATKDAVAQEDGSVKSVERDPANYEAEGVRYDNFVPLLLNLIKRQKEQIEAMEARLSALEAS
jgi:hypothetical protein